MEKEIALVYIVAGMSRRFGGKIKALQNIGPNNETLLEYSMNQALQSKFSKIILVVGEHTEKLFKQKLKNNYKEIPISYALQTFDKQKRDKPWGTADALISAKPFLNCPFIICNGDDLYGEKPFKDLFQHLSNNNSCATIGFHLNSVLPKEGKVNRGIFQLEEDFVKNIKEIYSIDKNNLSEKGLNLNSLCSMNIYALTPNVLQLLEEQVKSFKEKNKESRTAEDLIQTELSNLIKAEKIKMKIYPSGNSWIGITNPGDEKLVREFLKNKN